MKEPWKDKLQVAKAALVYAKKYPNRKNPVDEEIAACVHFHSKTFRPSCLFGYAFAKLRMPRKERSMYQYENVWEVTRSNDLSVLQNDADNSTCEITQDVDGSKVTRTLTPSMTGQQLKHTLTTDQSSQIAIEYGFPNGGQLAEHLTNFERPFAWTVCGIRASLQEIRYDRELPAFGGSRKFNLSKQKP